MAASLRMPPGFVASFGINERLRFLKDRHMREPVLAIVGASVATNSIDTDRMTEAEQKPALNFGAYGLTLDDQEPFYELIRSVQPVREVIFVSQYYEYRDKREPALVKPTRHLMRYVTGKMSPFEAASYYQLNGIVHYLTHEQELHRRQHATSIAYTPTGAVPLEMDVRLSDPDHLTASSLSTTPCESCLRSLERLCHAVAADGIRLVAVLPPVQLTAITGLERHQMMRKDRRRRIKAVVADCGGDLFDAGDFAPFDDGCFADYSHLNARGMRRFTEMLIAYRRGGFVPPAERIMCGG